MKWSSFTLSSLGLSALLHLMVIFLCFPYIEAEGDPSFYGWFNIVSRRDLFPEKKEVVFPKGMTFSSHSTRRRHLFPSRSPRLYPLDNDREYNLSSFLPESRPIPFLGDSEETPNCLYLWERGAVFPPREEEVISYRAYISPYGKALFLYPEKLPVNSYGNLHLQAYLREATFFLDNRFFWTKLEGVVK